MMAGRVWVKVITGASRNEVKREGDGFKVYLTAPPVEGKANKALLELLAEHLGCKKSGLKIIKGERSKVKVIQISGCL